MPILVKTIVGTVVELQGHAIVRLPDGSSRPLELGDVVHRGELIITTQDGIVRLETDDARLAGADALRTIEALESGTPEVAPAAGAQDGEVQEGLRVERIAEALAPFALPPADVVAIEQVRPIGAGDASAQPPLPGATNDAPAATPGAASGVEDTTLPVPLGGSDADGSVASVRIFSIPPGSTLLLPDGVTPVPPGSALTPAQAAGLLFVPPADASGTLDIVFVVIDDRGAESSPATMRVTLTPAEDLPVASADSATLLEDNPLVLPPAALLSNDRDADGDALVITGVSGAVNGSVAIDAAGDVVFTPAPDYSGPAGFAYTVTDGHGNTSTATVTLDVAPVNDAPDARNDLRSTDINTPLAGIAVLADDGDIDGDALVVTGATIDPVQGSVVVNADGTIDFTPAADFTGAAVVTYAVADGNGGTDSATLTINVGPNTPPTGSDATRTLAEDGSYIVASADFGFADADAGQRLEAVRIDALPGAGTLSLNGVAVVAGQIVPVAAIDAGRLVFTPEPDAGGAPYASFAFTVQDSAGAFDAAPNTFTFDVTPANDAPLAGNDVASTSEDTPLVIAPAALLGNDIDADGDPLVIASVQAAVNGSVAIDAAGNVVFTPAPGYSGPASFSYTIADAGGGSSSATVNVTVVAVNDAPLVASESAATQEDTPVSGNLLANDSDADGDALTLTQFAVGSTSYGAGSSASIAGVGTLRIDGDGGYTFTPAPNYNGAVPAVAYTVGDGSASSDGTLNLSVSPANDAPTATNDTRSTPINTPLANIAVLANDSDPDGDALGVSAASVDPAQGSVGVNADGTLSFAPATDFSGAATVSYTISDGAGGSDSATLTIDVGANTPPSGADATRTIAEDAGYTVASADFGFADADNAQSLAAVRIDTLPAAGRLMLNGVAVSAGQVIAAAAIDAGQLVFAPVADGNGTPYASFAFSVQDPAGAFDAAPNTLGFAVTPVADIAADSVVTAEDTAVAIAVLGNDGFENAGRAISAVNGSAIVAGGPAVAVANGTVALDAAGQQLVFTPAANYNGPASFTYTVTSGGASETASVDVTVVAGNDAPVAAPDFAVAVESGGAGSTTQGVDPTGNVLDNDTDVDVGDSKTVSAVSFGAASGSVGSALAGAYGTLTLNADGSYGYAVDNADAAVQALRTGSGTLTEVFGYTMRDAAGASSSSTLTVTIRGSNDAPVAVADVAAATEDVALNVDAASGVLANDSDVDAGDSRTVGAASFGAVAGAVGSAIAGTYGTLTLNADGSYGYLADRPAAQALAAGQTATEMFAYTISDASGATSSSTLTLTITGTNDAPINAVPLAQSTTEDTARVFSAANGNAITVADVDGVNLTTTIAVDRGTLTLGTTGGVTVVGDGTSSVQVSGTAAAINAALNGTTFRPVADAHGALALTVTTRDGSAGDVDSVPIAVAAVVDAPTLYAHLSTPSVAVGTTLFSDNFNDGNFSAPAWTRLQLTGNTFAPDPLSLKGRTESQLFADMAWNGQTSNAEWTNFWTVFNNQVHYNRGGGSGSDDAQGMLAYQNLAATDRARTAYSVSADMTANWGSQQNNGGGIAFGYRDASNYFLARWENPGTDYLPGGSQYNAYPGQANQLSLVQIVGGVPIDLGNFSGFSTPGFFNLRVDVGVSGIQVRVTDGSTYNDAPLINYVYGSVAGAAAAGPELNTIGLYTFDNDAGIAFDNVRVSGVDYSYALDLVATLNDVDGSETLSSIDLADLPAGVTLSGASGAIPISGGTASVVAASGIETTVAVTSSTPLTTAQINAITGSVTATDASGSSVATTVSVKSEILGTAGVNVLAGTGADEWIEGRAGNDTLNAGAGNDVLQSGSGNDSLTGGVGADVFAWTLADRGNGGAPAIDTIADFNTATPAAGGDALDLRDLLQGEGANSLQNYLDFSVSGGNTEVRISSSGGFAGGNYSAASEDQRIVLSGVDIRSALGLGGGATDAQIISELMNRGKLVTDAP